MKPSYWSGEKNRTENCSVLLCFSFLLYMDDDICFLELMVCYIGI